jgi:hypothetical protein
MLACHVIARRRRVIVLRKGEIRNPNIAVTRVKERPGFQIRNKFELPKGENEL